MENCAEFVCMISSAIRSVRISYKDEIKTHDLDKPFPGPAVLLHGTDKIYRTFMEKKKSAYVKNAICASEQLNDAETSPRCEGF